MSGYVIERAMIGHLQQKEIDVVRMPRARFLAIVDGLLDEDYPELRDKLRPVAETMPSFPLWEWINESRGCGCVVGEYLVATSELDRATLAYRVGLEERIEDLLAFDPQAADLAGFGEQIDERIRSEVRSYDTFGFRLPAAVLITDDSTEGEGA